MKTVCKKLLCLMLVAMMLVSAVPAAFAAEVTSCPDGHTGKQWTLKAEKHVDPTCTEAGKDVYYCGGDAEDETVSGHNVTFEIPALGHKWNDGEVTTAATCETDGVRTYTCERGCTETAKIDALGHAWDNGVVTKEPTCTEKGEKTFTCANDNTHTKKEEIPALGHDLINGICSRCKAGQQIEFTLTFHYTDANGNDATKTVGGVESGDVIASFPAIPDVDGLRFSYWKVDGAQFTAGDKWYDEMSTHFYAVYDESNDDNVVNLTVWAHYYVEGEYHHKERLYTQEFTKSEKNTMFTWLYSDVGMNKTRDRSAEYGYQWENEVYYDYHDEGAVTEADLKSNADKAVFIKVTSKDEIEASVMLYVHTKETATVDRVIPMPGYTAGDYVTQAAAKEAVKTKYSGSNLSISDLYTQAEWEDLLDDIDSTGAKSVKVEDNGITKIHVIVKNATSKYTADSSNPKTGDNIMIAVTTMTLAAAALVAMVELKKRKMI